MKHFELEVWKLSTDLVVDIYRATSAFPKEEMYGLTSQMRRCAVSIPSNISEGEGRVSRKETYQFMAKARGSLFELETQLFLSQRLGFLSDKQLETLREAINKIGPKLTNLMEYEKSRFDEKDQPTRAASRKPPAAKT